MKKLAIGLVAAAGLALAGPSMAQDKHNFSIATGGTGGVYYPMGGGLANLLTKHNAGWAATAEVTGGSVDNLKLVGAKKGDVIAFAMADATLDSAKGEDKFKGAPIPVRTLAVLYPNRMHVVTVEGKGIEKMADLKGKRVSTGSPGSATEVMAFRLIEAAGLDKDKDMRRERLGVAESTNAIKDGKIDAYFWVGGVPTSAVTDLGATPGTKLKLLDHAEHVGKMNAKYGELYAAGTIDKGAYPGQTVDNKQINVWNLLVVHQSMPDDVAYRIVKTLMDYKPDMVAVHADSQSFDVKNQKKDNSPIPFHPGAIKYFAEKGVTIN